MSIGLEYNGSKYTGIGNMNWFGESGIYAIRPTYLDSCPELPDRIKIGMAAGSSSRQLGVRLSNHSSSLVSFTILFIITVRSDINRPGVFRPNRAKPARLLDSGEGNVEQDWNMSKILEDEAHAWLDQQKVDGKEIERVLHGSGRKSEYFSEVPYDMLRSLFDHLIDIRSVPVSKHNWMPQIYQAYFFDAPIKGDGMTEPPSIFSFGYTLPQFDEKVRRQLQFRLKRAIKAKDGDLIDTLQFQLEALLSDAQVQIDLNEFDAAFPTIENDDTEIIKIDDSETIEIDDTQDDLQDVVEIDPVAAAMVGVTEGQVQLLNLTANLSRESRRVTRSMVDHGRLHLRSGRAVDRRDQLMNSAFAMF